MQAVPPRYPMLIVAILLLLPSVIHAAGGFDHLVALSTLNPPDREQTRDVYRFRRALSFSDVFGLRYMHYSPEAQQQVVGFQLVNRGSRRINPTGLANSGANREFRFVFPDRARQEIHLMITDDTRVSRRYSEDNMFREITFFPRHYLPTVTRTTTQGRPMLEVTLPTGEGLQFDPRSLEITGGVLSEQAIDRNPNRHQRHHPRVHYRGEFIAVISDQRGESTRRARVWGQDRFAAVHYPSKYHQPCRVSRAEIWDQRPTPGDSDPRLTMRYTTDSAFFAFVERRCDWDLSELKRHELKRPTPLLQTRPRIAAVEPNDRAQAKITVLDQDKQGLIGWFNRTFGAGSPPASESRP